MNQTVPFKMSRDTRPISPIVNAIYSALNRDLVKV